MSKFNDIANKLPKTYTFGRDKWFTVTDVLNLVTEPQTAREKLEQAEVAEYEVLDDSSIGCSALLCFGN